MARKLISAVLAAAALLFSGTACVTITTDDQPDDSTDGGAGSANRVTIRLVNASPTMAVDVQLYATGGVVNDLNADLFAPAHQLVSGIGFAGYGLLESGNSDTVVLPCDDALVVGTLGGRFLNEDTGDELGVGTRSVFFQGSQFECGATLTFTYTPVGNGFQTTVQISPPRS